MYKLSTLFFIVIYHQACLGRPSSKLTECTGNSCYPELYSNHFEGDILLPEGADQRNALSLKSHLWPRGEVPYIFDSSFKKKDKFYVLNAMRVIEKKTCIRFKPKTMLDVTYVSINQKDEGCYAGIGYRPFPFVGPLKMNLQKPGCYHNGTIQHELLHVLGLLHEQARPDRDDYVDILWDNIDKKYHNQFSKASNLFVTTYNISYDYKSVMHYPSNAFSLNGNATIIAKNSTTLELGQRVGATDGDLKKIRLMYHCQKENTETPLTPMLANNI